ncbi:Structural maintenance of chromosomes protein 4 [Acorus calamus]|uniref:Structural maintenance of chromosomes protein 4 n=1 Tax=Acorus calamus TaxID=4465 RepID=A0AAV9D5Q6_ACOCL|nr:Structural maintenance of chromosomes protein 4 [Acorus calamus]
MAEASLAMEADAKKRTPRLFIKEMVMSNFKSYAAEQRVGPFHKREFLKGQSFSAVVGPNGSGKSNVIDAMLFVFDKRAKQEKQFDLLHKMKEKVNTPEGVPRLFDLVRVNDERLKLAFFSALGNTIVAQDLDQRERKATQVRSRAGIRASPVPGVHRMLRTASKGSAEARKAPPPVARTAAANGVRAEEGRGLGGDGRNGVGRRRRAEGGGGGGGGGGN